MPDCGGRAADCFGCVCMELLQKTIDLKKFFSSLQTSRERILMLDYDGTLAPFREIRDEAVPYAGVEKLLDEIMETDRCRVVLVSGRWTKDLIKLITLKRMPEIWGSHGWERMLPDNTYTIPRMPEKALQGLACVEDWLSEAGLYGMCEPKPASVALHWRGLNQTDIDDIKTKIRNDWYHIAHSQEIERKEFDGGIEFRVPGKSKGDAVREILSEAGTDRTVAYLGDDATDEDAFEALAAQGLRILVRKSLRPTRADVWLIPPEELLLFLEDWRDVCRGNAKSRCRR